MSSSSTNDVFFQQKCQCGANMKPMISRSEKNPNRKYWKCNNIKDGVYCGKFVWDDDIKYSSTKWGNLEKNEIVDYDIRELNSNVRELNSNVNAILTLLIQKEQENKQGALMRQKTIYYLCVFVIALGAMLYFITV